MVGRDLRWDASRRLRGVISQVSKIILRSRDFWGLLLDGSTIVTEFLPAVPRSRGSIEISRVARFRCTAQKLMRFLIHRE